VLRRARSPYGRDECVDSAEAFGSQEGIVATDSVDESDVLERQEQVDKRLAAGMRDAERCGR
jgi:hypothetical protein